MWFDSFLFIHVSRIQLNKWNCRSTKTLVDFFTKIKTEHMYLWELIENRKCLYLHSSPVIDAQALYYRNAELKEEHKEKHKKVEGAVTPKNNNKNQTVLPDLTFAEPKTWPQISRHWNIGQNKNTRSLWVKFVSYIETSDNKDVSWQSVL